MEQGVAPAVVFRKHRSGTPRVAVRPYYEGLPSMAGRGTERRRRKPHGHVGARSPGPSPEARLRGKKRHSGAPGGGRAGHMARGAFVKVPDVTQRLSALRSLMGV